MKKETEKRVCPGCGECFECDINATGGRMCDFCIDEMIDRANEILDELQEECED